MRLIKYVTAAAIAAALLIVPAGALARSRDRDHDRMPDKWEKKHHLNTRANDARKDPDRDHLSNLSEFRHHSDPRKADTDNDGIDDDQEVEDHTSPTNKDTDDDGIKDDDEVSGAIVSFTNGLLTIQLAGDGAGQVSGMVTDATKIECENDEDDDAPAQPTATTSRDGSDDDNSGPGSDSSGPGSGDDQGDDNDDQGEDEGQCTSADLKATTRVHEAEFVTTANGKVFTEIELVPSA
jgi:hypothetical protein